MKKSTNQIIIILMVIIEALYIAWVWSKYGAQQSLSKSIFVIKKNKRILFRIFIFSFCTTIIIGADNIYYYIAAGLILLVGIFIDIDVPWKKTIHMIGAVGGTAMLYFALILSNPWSGGLGLALAVVTWLVWFINDNPYYWLWWGEIILYTVASGVKSINIWY